MGEIKYNGRTYSGLIQANGCFVDTDNVIASGTVPSDSTATYTATEDCYFVGGYYGNGDDGRIEIDGKIVSLIYVVNNSTMLNYVTVPVHKGQVVTIKTKQYNGTYTVYGLLQGSPITFLSEYASACYDTNEREVGCWVDGKPIYQKTIDCGTLPNNTTKNVAHGISNLEFAVAIKGSAYNTNNGVRIPIPYVYGNIKCVQVYLDDTNIKLISTENLSVYATSYVTVLYTKTTDTAGSGHLTPTGFETHHYSTNEQIVGTWIDGKPLYEVTVEVDNPTISTYSDNKYIDSNYSSSVIDFAKCVNCAVYDSNDSRWYTLPYQRMISSENVNMQAMRISNGSCSMTVHWKSTNSYNITKIRYTIQFTKTTD